MTLVQCQMVLGTNNFFPDFFLYLSSIYLEVINLKIFLFIFGTCWASFITTMTWRYLIQNHPQYRPACSICDQCHQQISSFNLIPIIGFLLQGGNCKLCHSRIDPLWTILEFVNGLVWCLMPLLSLKDYLAFLIIDCCLLALCVQDWFEQKVSFFLFAGLIPLYWLEVTPTFSFITLIWGLFWIFGYFSVAIGNGDIDFMLIITLLAGPIISTRAVAIACCLGLLYAYFKRRQTLPFIPFLACGLSISLILQCPTFWF